jgi:putative transposase
VETPRDRKGSFEPKLVAKRQTRLADLDERILSFYIGGMSVRDIAQHLSDLYGREIGRDTISRVTNAVLEDLEAWRTTPPEAVYPIAYFDCLMVKVREDRSVRTRACYLAVGVTVDGERDVLGIWWQETESAKLRLAVLNDLHQRGVKDVMICCVDGLAGFPRGDRGVYPQAWVQTCIVHQIRTSMRYVAYKDRKAIARDLKPVYRAVNPDAAREAIEAFDEQWDERYPMIAESWRARWQHIHAVPGRTPSRDGPGPPAQRALKLARPLLGRRRSRAAEYRLSGDHHHNRNTATADRDPSSRTSRLSHPRHQQTTPPQPVFAPFRPALPDLDVVIGHASVLTP